MSTLVDAIRAANGRSTDAGYDAAVNGAPEVPVRLTQPGSAQAAQGISMAEMIQRAVAEAVAGMMAGGALNAPQANAPASKNGKAKADVTAKPAAPKPAGPWYVKPCERWGIDAKDAMVNDHVLVTRNPEPKYGKVFMLIRGKSKPVCFNAEAYGNLVASCGLMGKFAKDFAGYLAEDNATD